MKTPPLVPVCVLVMLLIPESWPKFLYRASPGGDGVAPAGLWGGYIGTEDGGHAEDLYLHGLSEVETGNGNVYGLDITGLSYDPVTKNILMEVDDVSTSGFIARGSPCTQSMGNVEIIAGNVQLVDSQHPYLIDEECGWKCGWHAFAQYNQSVYFLLSAVFGDHQSELRREIQVRRLLECPDLRENGNLNKVTELNVMQCSELVVSLHSSQYAWPNPALDVWAGSAMKAVLPSHGNDGVSHDFQLYVQLFNKTETGVKMTLLQVGLKAGEVVGVSTLHVTPVASVYSGNWQVRGLGEMDYRDGILCWTAAEVLLCGRVNGNALKEVTTLLEEGEAYNAAICTGEMYPLPTGKVLTGVSIDSSRDPFAVYFGCFTERPGKGGMGMLRLSVSFDGVTRQLVPVKSDGNPVLAGSMFLIDDISRACGESTTPQDDDKTSKDINTSYGSSSSTSGQSGGIISPVTADNSSTRCSITLFLFFLNLYTYFGVSS